MGLVSISRKNNLKNVELLKIILLVQIDPSHWKFQFLIVTLHFLALLYMYCWYWSVADPDLQKGRWGVGGQSGKKFTLWASDLKIVGASPGSATDDRCDPILIATVIYPIKWVNWSKQVKLQILTNCHMRSFRNKMFQNHFLSLQII